MSFGLFSILSLPIPTINGIPDVPGVYEFKLPKKLTDEEFYYLCSINPDLFIEQDKNGKLIIMPPVSFDSGNYEDDVHRELSNWRYQKGKGKSPSPSTGFKLPDGSTHCPDSSWISEEKVANLTKEERKTFAPVVPDFVIEVRSSSDRIKRLKDKMKNVWMKNGVRLGWLIDPVKQKAYIYRQGKPVESIPDFDQTLFGEDVCVGFELDLRELKGQ